MLQKIISGFRSRATAETENAQFSIGITTFEARFEKYFTPLLNAIREFDNETEIIIAVNGEHKTDFSEAFRKEILGLIASHKNVFPVFFPRFRGLSKLWNTIIIHSSSENILVLNDDIMIRNAGTLNKVRKEILNNPGQSFVINDSWSHFLINRKEIDEIGYFDERLLGIGEEDGDLCWRYLELFGRPVKRISISGFKNYAEETMSERPANIECRPGMKYSTYNRKFIGEKYAEDPDGRKGMFDKPVRMKDRGERQYPNESYYRKNRDKL